MKKTLQFFVFSFLLLSTSQLYSQRFREVVLWEIKTTNGGLIVGASLDEASADFTINSFTARNKGLKYQTYSTNKKFTTHKVVKTADLLSDLKLNTSRGYVVISPEELQVLEKNKGKSLSEIASIYAGLGNNSYEEAMQEIQLISKYQINKRLNHNATRLVSK